MALFRKLKSGRIARTFNPTAKKKGDFFIETEDRIITDEDRYLIAYLQTANRIKAIKETNISEDLKTRFIEAEFKRLETELDIITIELTK